MDTVVRIRVGMALLVLCAACGSGPHPRPATHDDFRTIQQLEAVIADAAACSGTAADCTGAFSRARTAADELCRLTGELSDADATTRCEREGATCARLGVP